MVTSGGRPPLAFAKLHDDEEGDAIEVSDMEAIAPRRGSPRASHHKVFGSGYHGLIGSGRHELTRSGRHELTRSGRHELSGSSHHEQRGLPARHSRVVARLGLDSLGTVAAVGERPYACTDCPMTFGRETALCGHMRSHKRDNLSFDSEKDASTPKRWKKQKSKLRTVKPLEATWGNHARRNGIPRDAPAEVKVSESEFDHSDNDISMSVIDDDDDNANPVITITGSHGAPSLASDAAATIAMAPTPTVAVATPMPAPHAAKTSVNIEGAPNVSTTAVAIAPTPASAVATTTVGAAIQSAPDRVKRNNDFGQAGARYRYGDNDKAFARKNNNSGKSLASYGNIKYGNDVAGYSDADHRGKGVSGCSSGSHTYNTSTAAGGKSSKGCGKVYSCRRCNASFRTHQALGGHVRSHHKIMEKENNGSGEAHGHIEVILALPAPGAPVHQPPQGTMAMADNPVTGHFPAANTSTGWSLLGTNSSSLPAIPLHDQQQKNPPEQMVAGAPHNHGNHSINPALFSVSRRQEIAVAPSNAIASSSSTPRPGIAATTEPNQAIEINNHFAPIDAPANTMGRRLTFFQAGKSNTQALPAFWPVHHPTQKIAMDGNPLNGHFPATISATGWSFPATTSSVLPSIPLQNQEDGRHSFNPALFSKRQEKNPLEEILVGPRNAITRSTPTPHPSSAATEPYHAITEVNSNAAAIDALVNTMNHLPFFPTGRSAIQAPPVSKLVHQPTQGIAAIVGNPVIDHFPAAMAGNGYSFPATTSSVLPTICLQTQEENRPQARVGPANELADPSQNQADNPLEGRVPGNNRGRTIRLFGTNIAEGQKEVKEPTN